MGHPLVQALSYNRGAKSSDGTKSSNGAEPSDGAPLIQPTIEVGFDGEWFVELTQGFVTQGRLVKPKAPPNVYPKASPNFFTLTFKPYNHFITV